MLQELEGFTYTTAVNLNMGYYTIRLDPAASEMCTIIFPWGKFSYKWLPIGFKGSANIFQVQMIDLVASLEFEYVQAHFDDLLIITIGTLDDHLLKIEAVLTRLCNAGLKVNAAKSPFCTHEIKTTVTYWPEVGLNPSHKRYRQFLHFIHLTTLRNYNTSLECYNTTGTRGLSAHRSSWRLLQNKNHQEE
jgi:hypothetical protein